MIMKRKSVLNLLFFTFMTLAFTLAYFKNSLHVVEQDRFEDAYDIYCQSQVIGRLIRAETNGILSDAGLNGWVRDDSVMKDMTWEEMAKFQYRIYREGIDLGPSNFIIYDSQLGGQAMFFALIGKISPFSNSVNLDLFWIMTSLSLALLISVFVFWLSKNYGFMAALIAFLLILFTPMLTMLGRDLYLVPSSFYFPFIVMLLLLYFESSGKFKVTPGKLFLISFVLIFIKLFFSGFEFITTALIMFTVPMFYYLILNKWSLKLFFKRFAGVVSGSVTAIILHALLYSYQLSTLKGSLMWGINNLLSCFLRRTYGNSADFPEAFKASLEANVSAVLKLYYTSPALGFGRLTFLTFGTLIYILIMFSVLCFVPEKISPSLYKNRKKNMVLAITTWISLSATFSWFIIFKAHAYVHFYGYDDIVWCMPFALFGFALIGSVGSSVIKDVIGYFRKYFLVHL
jgi:hypothetical protein